MPKQVVNKDEILEAALQMVRTNGCEYVNARSIAKFMGYSVQPIYSYFVNMEQLKEALYAEGLKFYNRYIYSHVEKSNILTSMAMANIDFAKHETNLFKMLFLTKIKGLDSLSNIYEMMGDKDESKRLSQSSNLTEEQSKQIYIKLIIFTHGIATMIATSGLDVSDNQLFAVVDDAYRAFIMIEKSKETSNI